jgi:putative transposase
MIDGVGLKDHTCVVALGITTDGVNPARAVGRQHREQDHHQQLLSNLVHRGLDVEQGVLVVIDGSKALRAAVNDVLGKRTPVQRCQIHKERNVLDHLATTAQGFGGGAQNQQEHQHPVAGPPAKRSSITTPGVADLLPRHHPACRSTLKKTLASTNPCESMIECVRRSSRNVKYWQNGEMCLRWTAAGMLEAEQQFRRVVGHADLAKLAARVEREVTLHQPNHAPTDQDAIVAAA